MAAVGPRGWLWKDGGEIWVRCEGEILCSEGGEAVALRTAVVPHPWRCPRPWMGPGQPELWAHGPR